MGRHAEELEAERTYELVKREKEKTGTWLKSFLKFLFSQVGLVILVGVVAVGGEDFQLHTRSEVWPLANRVARRRIMGSNLSGAGPRQIALSLKKAPSIMPNLNGISYNSFHVQDLLWSLVAQK